MTVPIPTPPPPPPSDLPRKLTLLFLLAIAAALGIVLLFRAGYPLAYLNLLILASALLGLVSGFGARLVLRKRRAWLRMLAAFAMLGVGMIVLGLFSGGKYGLSPAAYQSGRFDWAGLIQMVFGMLAAGLSLFAWRRRAPSIPSAAAEEPSTQPAVRSGTPDLLPQPERIETPKPRRARLTKRLRPSTGSKLRSRARVRPAAKPKTKTGRSKSTASGPKRRSRKTDIQFAGGEEHRCPYCLELIRPKDPRGIVECKICHTLHHADCWAVTGACQIPHLNS
jgi:ribosomal protein L37AE/L43A